MNQRILLHVAILSLSLFAFHGCKKKTTSTQPALQKNAAENKSARSSGKKVSSLSWLVPAYEVVRKALAADNLKAAKNGAAALAKLAKKEKRGGIVGSSERLSATKDMAAARLAFGELSKQTILLLQKQPSLTKGLTAYQCPMAKGYKKWLQADSEMANPYMGKRMLKCGGKTALTP